MINIYIAAQMPEKITLESAHEFCASVDKFSKGQIKTTIDLDHPEAEYIEGIILEVNTSLDEVVSSIGKAVKTASMFGFNL